MNSDRTFRRRQAAYRELVEILYRTGVHVWSHGTVSGAEFYTPTHEERGPILATFSCPQRALPGPALLEAYNRAKRECIEERAGKRRRIPVGVLVFTAPGRGVREHVAALPLPDLLRLLREAGRLRMPETHEEVPRDRKLGSR